MSSDRWARWLLEDRFGGDEDAVSRSVEMLAPIRDRVLLGANVKRGDVVLDVGCGDGLIGFEAVLGVGETGQVMFADISDDLLDRCRQIAKDIGVSDRCRFIATPAESLDGIDNASVDVVATRSVLIFVADKAAAFAAFHRVLRPGGRISLFEPINRRYIALNRDLIFGFESAPIADLVRSG
ncbi:MAG: class I SAM-dependent methyltransferase [Acidimicrobiia bacterium]